MESLPHEELLARIGRDYYLDNRSKVEIANAYGISRFQVARLLDEARTSGVVRIEVTFPRENGTVDTADLAAALGIKRVVVTDSAPDDLSAREILAKAVAEELMLTAQPNSTLGISWSRTLDRASHYVTQLPQCDIVQLAGALPAAGSGNPLELIQRLGQRSGGATWPIWAPLVVENAATAESLARQPEISEALHRADSLDVAVIAIGAWTPGLSTVWDRVDNAVRLEAAHAGAVTECSGRLIDAEGNEVHSGLDSRVIAVTLRQLQHTPAVIAVAQGPARAAAVLAAIKAGIVSTLVMDRGLAIALSSTLGQQQAIPPDGGQ